MIEKNTMRQIIAVFCLLLTLSVTLTDCGTADTREARLTTAREILRSNCNSLSDIIIKAVKEQTKVGATDSSAAWAKAADLTVQWGLKILIAKECDCVTEPIAEKLADHYTLGELEGFRNKSLLDITYLPEAVAVNVMKIKSCVPGL